MAVDIRGRRELLRHTFPKKKTEAKIFAPAGNQTRVWSVAGTYTITVLPALATLCCRGDIRKSDFTHKGFVADKFGDK